MPTRESILAGVRILFALCIVLSGTCAPAIRMMLPEPVTCGMACCEESGVCYCHAKLHAEDEEASSERPQGPQLAADVLASPCPAQCAQVPAGFQKDFVFVQTGLPEYVASAEIAERVDVRASHVARDALLSASISPRAPPISLL